MKILVACEFSGIVREAFRKKGHDAWSCDLLPTEIPGQHHQENSYQPMCFPEEERQDEQIRLHQDRIS